MLILPKFVLSSRCLVLIETMPPSAGCRNLFRIQLAQAAEQIILTVSLFWAHAKINGKTTAISIFVFAEKPALAIGSGVADD